MFSLYHSKKEKKLEIKPIKNNSLMVYNVTDKVTSYNDCYFVCNNRKALKEKATEIKNSWIEEAEKELNALKEIEIKNKY